MTPATYGLLADAVLVLHVAVVLFVVCGLLVVIGGNLARWHWVNRWWLRLAHLGAIAFVAAQAWLGAMCPLTVWEIALRRAAGHGAYHGGFLQHWLHRLLYWDAPDWVFTCAYTVFGMAVAWAWWRWPPRRSP